MPGSGGPQVIVDRRNGWYETPGGLRVRGLDNAVAAVNGGATRAHQHSGSSDRMNRLRFARKAGFQYGNERDVYTVAGYVQESDLDFDHYWSRYQRQDIAGRIVDMAPKTTWRHPPEIHEKDSEEETDFTRAFRELADRLGLWNHLERADRLSRIGQYGVLFMGTPGVDQTLKDPLESVNGPEDVLYLSSFHQGDVKVTEWEQDTGKERFGQPLVYRIKLSEGVENFPDVEEEIHHSRVVHIAEDRLSDEVHGRPALKRVFNRLMDLEKITAATAEAYWQLADKILLLSIDPNVEIGKDDRDALGKAAEEMMHDLRRQIVGSGIEGQWLDAEPPNPADPAELYMMLIGAGAEVPFRILFGNTTGERASTEDQKEWLGRIQERETNHAEPVILRPLVDRWIQIGALPEPRGGYRFEWPNRFQLDEKDEAELSKTRAETAKSLTPIGGDPRELVVIESDRVHLVDREEVGA
ncbi:MAG: anti-CBASS protein Acb1 family protein [Longimicrobiales bacterium]